jgi:predicted nucleotidyltransferase component of viral defense system
MSQPANLAASVRQRLLNISRASGEAFDLTLGRYGRERFLYRLSTSQHSDRFVLKGATLFLAWQGEPHRVTRDLDLLGTGEFTEDTLTQLIRDVTVQEVPDDALTFDADTIRVFPIRENQAYDGLRATLTAHLGRARIPLQIDIGFGDAVTPEAQPVQLPPMLDLPAPTLLAYPPETVVAEKLEALVSLGIANTRMKDFYDLWHLSRTFAFDGAILRQAVDRTFERRRTPRPDTTPIGLTADFSGDASKQAQWRGFAKRSHLDAPELGDIVQSLAAFLLPLLQPVSAEAGHWHPDYGWAPSPRSRRQPGSPRGLSPHVR